MDKIDKKLFQDKNGKLLTQSLFLEYNYNIEYAVYTFNNDDKMYKDKLYPSLRKRYLEVGDPTEYQFAVQHLFSWDHWVRLNENKELRKEFDNWRDELEVALRSQALLTIADMTENFQAQKFLVDRGWDKNPVGRPSKAGAQRDKAVEDRIADELKDTLTRMDRAANRGIFDA